MAWSLYRCAEGHEANAIRKLDQCPHPGCGASVKCVRGPLKPKAVSVPAGPRVVPSGRAGR